MTTYQGNEEQGFTEGWGASICIGSGEVPDDWCEIQRIDEQGIFGSDLEALAHVVNQAVQGSTYHKSALQYVDAHNFELVKQSNKWVDMVNRS